VVDAAPAPYVDTPAPEFAFSKDPDGQIRLHVAPPPGARLIALKLKPDTTATVTSVAGVPIRLVMKPGADTRLNWSAAQPGFDIVIRPGGPGKLAVGYSVTEERWPATAKPLPPRPADVMPFDVSDSTLLVGARSFSW